MSKESKIILAVAAGVVALIALLITFVNSSQVDPAAISERLVREDSRSVGSGPVEVVEFGDYQCPACAQVHTNIELLKKEFEGKMVFVYRNFPLPLHPNAQPAAHAAEAAGTQGKFWEMHNKIFETQDQWAALADPTDLFVTYAEELELDTEKFRNDVTTQANKERISKDQSDGYAVGVSGTPTFFINGERQTSFEYESLKRAIEAKL